MSNLFGVYEEPIGGGDGVVDSHSIDSFTPTNLFDNLDNTNWFDQNFKMEQLTDSMILDAMKPMTDQASSGGGGGTATIPKRTNDQQHQDVQYADLTNVQMQQQIGHDQPIQQQQPQRDDDGYGSQTAIYAAGLMDSPTADDDFGPVTRERCHTWPSVQRNEEEDRRESGAHLSSYQQRRHHHPYQRPGHFSPSGLQSRTPSGLSLISESNESLSVANGGQLVSRGGGQPMTPVKMVDGQRRTAGQWMLTPANLDEQSQEALLKGSVIGGASISRHSSGSADSTEPSLPVKQIATPSMTMSNYKAGHPSYVELITHAINSSPEKRMTLSEIYDWMVANVPAFKDQRYLHSSSGWKNSVRHNLSLHSRFKRVKRNGMDKPSWWTVDPTEEIKRERTNKRPTKGGTRPRANTTTAAIYHPPQQMKNQQMAMGGRPQQQQQQQISGQILLQQGSQSCVMDAGRRGSLQASRTATKTQTIMTGTPRIGLLQDTDHMEWTQYAKMESMETIKASLSQAITVTLNQVLEDANFGTVGGKTDIALTITVGDDSVHPDIQQQQHNNGNGSMTNLVSAFRHNTLDEAPGRQLLRVKTNAGHVQEVAVPIPMPIRVVTKVNKDCQTETEPMITSTMASGVWMDPASIKQDQLVASLDELMALSEVNVRRQQEHQSMPVMMQQHLLSPNIPNGQQLQTSGPVSPSEMLNSYFQPHELAVNEPQKNTTTSATTLLPEDLAALDVRDTFDCDIMDILSFEMNCTGNTSTSTGASNNGSYA